MATMFEVDKAAQEYSRAHDALTAHVRALEAEVARIRQAYLPKIRKAVEAAASRKADLRDVLEESRELFAKPKMRVMHGVKVGVQKSKGKIVIEDEVRTVELIRKNFPDQADLLIKCVERPVKSAMNEMAAQDLKRIGVMVQESGEVIVIEPTDSEIDALVDALLKDSEPEAA